MNKEDEKDRTALMYAALNGNVGCIKILLMAGADHTEIDLHWNRALAIAVKSGNLEAVKLLLEIEYDHNEEKYREDYVKIFYRPPLEVAIDAEKKEMVELMLGYCSDISDLLEEHIDFLCSNEELLEDVVVTKGQFEYIISKKSFGGDNAEEEKKEYSNDLAKKLCIVEYEEGSRYKEESKYVTICNYQDILPLFKKITENNDFKIGDFGYGIALFFAKCAAEHYGILDSNKKEIINNSVKLKNPHSLKSLAAKTIKNNINVEDLENEGNISVLEAFKYADIFPDGRKWCGVVRASLSQEEESLSL
ncbi:ankyrin repeat domain-containing protein [Rickettsiales bacterium]|nr:ankyrin repeat domain-containing protein [Rickettsiales bacterium]